jgi:hypothetical protein
MNGWNLESMDSGDKRRIGPMKYRFTHHMRVMIVCLQYHKVRNALKAENKGEAAASKCCHVGPRHLKNFMHA